MRQSLLLAVAQPRTYLRGWKHIFPVPFDDDAPSERQQLDEAVMYIERAAARGADLLLFPEMYPGPLGSDGEFTLEETIERLTAAARSANLWVIFSGAERDGAGGDCNTVHIAKPDGEIAATYRKMIPANGEPWTPGQVPLVVDCDGVKVGIATCWEAWFPEIPRMLTWMGADLILCPTGALLYELTPQWQIILSARAAENIVYTAASVNLFGLEDGMNVIFSPEGLVAQADGEGLLCAALDLERLRYLRRTDERLTVPKLYRSIPGLLRALPPQVMEQYLQVAAQFIQTPPTLQK